MFHRSVPHVPQAIEVATTGRLQEEEFLQHHHLKLKTTYRMLLSNIGDWVGAYQMPAQTAVYILEEPSEANSNI